MIARALFGSLVLIAIAASASPAAAACKKGQVEVKKTALRRGPGLNYPVSTMIEDGKCWKVLERSTDDLWVMIEGAKDTIGWVPASMIDEADRAAVQKDDKKQTGPVGSGQERGFVIARTAATLLEKPDASAEAKRVLPAGSKLLALAMSKDGDFVEVRDERGETGWVASRGLSDEGAVLPSLPRMDTGVTGKKAESQKEQPKRTVKKDTGKKDSGQKDEIAATTADPDTRLVPSDEQKDEVVEPTPPQTVGGPANITLELVALGALPSIQLDSNGAAAYRRYSVNAFATGAHVEAKADAFAPVRMRIAYNFVLLTGLALAVARDRTIGGQVHDARLLVGYPIDLGTVKIVPELGYQFALFAMEPAIPGTTTVQFLSSQTHGASLGATAEIAFTPELSLELEASGLGGTTIESPIDLGGAKLSLGARAGVAFGYALGGGAGLVARYQLSYRSTSFSGMSTTDSTITRATLSNMENTFGVGLTFAL